MLDARACLRLGGLAAVVALALAPASARAQTNPVLAESLYDEAKQLFFKKDFAGACPKLAESDRLDPAGGTILMLGECYEGEGKLASARAALDEAISRARRDRRADREREAREHLKAIEPRIPKYVIEVADEARALPGLDVRSGGVTVPGVSYGIPLSGDPGTIEITASAPGREPFRGALTLRERETARLRIGALAPRPVEVAPGPRAVVVAPPPPPPPSSVAVPVSITLGSVGVAALAVGGAFGALAIRDAHTVRDRCGSAPTCGDLGAVHLAHTADGEATAADVLVPVGAAALVAGLVVFLARPVRSSASSPTTGAAPTRWASGSF